MIKITNISTGFSKNCKIAKVSKDCLENERYNVDDFGLDTLYVDAKTFRVSSKDVTNAYWIKAELV